MVFESSVTLETPRTVAGSNFLTVTSSNSSEPEARRPRKPVVSLDGRRGVSIGDSGNPRGTTYPEEELPCSDADDLSSGALASAGCCDSDLSTITKVRMLVIAAKARAFSQKPAPSEGCFGTGR